MPEPFEPEPQMPLTLSAEALALVRTWRERAELLDSLSPPAAEAWRRAAADLEARLAPTRADVLEQFIRVLRRGIMHDIAQLRAARRQGGPAGPPLSGPADGGEGARPDTARGPREP